VKGFSFLMRVGFDSGLLVGEGVFLSLLVREGMFELDWRTGVELVLL
jgi:hypothetical protein